MMNPKHDILNIHIEFLRITAITVQLAWKPGLTLRLPRPLCTAWNLHTGMSAVDVYVQAGLSEVGTGMSHGGYSYNRQKA